MNIYSDPHHGLTLGSNTTPESRKRLQDYITEHTYEIAWNFKFGPVICAGDFFDKYQNPEEVLLESLPTFRATSHILSGNHDVVNIAGRKGSLDVLYAMDRNRIIRSHFGVPCYEKIQVNGVRDLYMVPHHSSQELFEEALEAAMLEACRYGGKKSLVLHCNYNSEFIKDKIALDLPQRQAARLLNVFDFIFIGHEHNHRTDLNDRVIVVGSPHPVSFGDMTDKFIIEMETDTPKLVPVWSVNKHYLEVPYPALLGRATPDHQFIRVTGEILPSQLHELAASIKKVWDTCKPFAIRSEVQVITGDKESSRYTGMNPDRLQHIISAELKKTPELYDLWKEITSDQAD